LAANLHKQNTTYDQTPKNRAIAFHISISTPNSNWTSAKLRLGILCANRGTHILSERAWQAKDFRLILTMSIKARSLLQVMPKSSNEKKVDSRQFDVKIIQEDEHIQAK
jgi:hypothetical protein